MKVKDLIKELKWCDQDLELMGENNDQEELHNDAVIDNQYERSCDES
jgi:hypothetical protein